MSTLEMPFSQKYSLQQIEELRKEREARRERVRRASRAGMSRPMTFDEKRIKAYVPVRRT